jgi:hypothetical protein
VRTQSHSSIKKAQRCKRAYKYGYIDKLQPKEKPPQLVRGVRYHEIFEAYYLGELAAIEPPLTPDETDFITRYHEYWQEEDYSFKVIDVEPELEMRLPSGRGFVFKPDLIIQLAASGELWVVDHKTVKNIPDEYNPYNMSDWQHLLYLEGVSQNYDHPPAGFMFNYARSKPPTQPRLTKTGKIAYLGTIDTTAEILLDFAEAEGLDGDADVQDRLAILRGTPSKFYQRHWLASNYTAVVHTVLDLEAQLDELERNYSTDEWPRHVLPAWAGSAACNRCEFQGICHADLMGISAEPEVFGLEIKPPRKQES